MIDAELAALEAELRAAQLGADVGALDRLIAEDLLFTRPDGARRPRRPPVVRSGSNSAAILSERRI
jgi:hypothetical protein